MAEDALHPGLREIAEQYLNRPLEANEQAQLLKLQQGFQGPAPSPASPGTPGTHGTPASSALDAVEQARQQAQRTIGQGQTQASSTMRNILESIQASSSKALQVQQQEEQAILKLLESCKTLSDLRPASLNPGLANLKAGNRLALTQIADHLANLAKQEVESRFNQHFGPLAAQLQALIERLSAEESARAAESGRADAAQNAPQGASQSTGPSGVHDAAGPASMQ
jgi:hypothetical protein